MASFKSSKALVNFLLCRCTAARLLNATLSCGSNSIARVYICAFVKPTSPADHQIIRRPHRNMRDETTAHTDRGVQSPDTQHCYWQTSTHAYIDARILYLCKYVNICKYVHNRTSYHQDLSQIHQTSNLRTSPTNPFTQPQLRSPTASCILSFSPIPPTHTTQTHKNKNDSRRTMHYLFCEGEVFVDESLVSFGNSCRCVHCNRQRQIDLSLTALISVFPGKKCARFSRTKHAHFFFSGMLVEHYSEVA